MMKSVIKLVIDFWPWADVFTFPTFLMNDSADT